MPHRSHVDPSRSEETHMRDVLVDALTGGRATPAAFTNEASHRWCP